MFPNKYYGLGASLYYRKQIRKGEFPDITKTIITLLDYTGLTVPQIYEKLLKESPYRNINDDFIHQILDNLLSNQPEGMPIIFEKSELCDVEGFDFKFYKRYYGITEFTSRYISLLTINKEDLEIISIIKLYGECTYFDISRYINNDSIPLLIVRLDLLIKNRILLKQGDMYKISPDFLLFLKDLENETHKKGIVGFFSE